MEHYILHKGIIGMYGKHGVAYWLVLEKYLRRHSRSPRFPGFLELFSISYFIFIFLLQYARH